MKFLSRLSLKNFSVFAVFLGIFIVAFPAVSVFAASQSPSDLNIFSITSGEQNKQLNRNCGYSTAEGLLAGSLSALEQIAAVRFEDYAEKVYCEEGDITGLFNSDKSTGVLGVLNKVNNTILAQRPASGVQFIEDKVYAITNPGVVHADEPPSYFPGTGFDLLQPIRGFWGWAVNLVFGVLVILIIFVAFAIIFRVKLPGNVTVTLQNSIPNIALAMILVPLSYAISGLFIDAITIGTNAIHDFLLGPASPGYSVYASRDTNGNDRGLYVDDDRVTWINARSLVDVSQEVEGVALQTGLDAGPLQVVGSFLNIFDEDTINANSANPGGTSAWLGTIINALLSIVMIWIGIKIFIRLFKKYITLMITPIFAPFVFATVAVPGNGTKAIMNFVKLMGSASLGFIVTYGMILLTVIFSSEAFQATIPNMNTGLWNPPLLGLGNFLDPGQTVSGVVSGVANNSSIVPFIMALISIGIYFSIPNVLDQIDQALGGNMSLPKFIMTPIESFRESVKVTGGAFRGVAVTGARGVNVARNSPEAGRRLLAGANIVERRRIARERAAGLTVNSPGSLEYEKKRKLDNAWAEQDRIQKNAAARVSEANEKLKEGNLTPDQRRTYEQQRDQNLSIATNAQNEKNKIDRLASTNPSSAITLSHTEKPEDKLQLKVSFVSNLDQAQNAINFTTDIVSQLGSLLSPLVGSPKKVPNILAVSDPIEGYPIGKLVFNISGSGLAFSPGQEIELGKPKGVGYSDEVDFEDGTAKAMSTVGLEDIFVAGGGNPMFDGHFKLFVDQTGGLDKKSPYVIKDNGKTIEVKLKLFIDQVEHNSNPKLSLFGERVERDGLAIGWKNGNLLAGAASPSSSLIFRIMGKPNEKTGEFKMFVKATWKA